MSNFTSPPKNEPQREPDLPPMPPLMPVETEIYILPSGEVVIADLPAELAAQFAAWNPSEVDS